MIERGLAVADASAPSATHRVRSSSFVVCLVHLVYLVSLVQPNKRDKPNKRKQPDGLQVSRGTCSFVTGAFVRVGFGTLTGLGHVASPYFFSFVRSVL